jgi:membrane-bound ClpP family serine protease
MLGMKELFITVVGIIWIILGIRTVCRSKGIGPCVTIATADILFLILYVLFWPFALFVDKISIKHGFVWREPKCNIPEVIGSETFISPCYEIGSSAVTITNLKPSGKIQINGKRYNALSEGNFIASGIAVCVSGKRGDSLIVKEEKASNHQAELTANVDAHL